MGGCGVVWWGELRVKIYISTLGICFSNEFQSYMRDQHQQTSLSFVFFL